MERLIQTLSQVNWDFSDYSSQRFPLDMNSIPWYPATFPPPIPKFLISLLTKPGDIVFDPFGGSGTTVIEALKQNRLSFYNDLNSFAVDTVRDLVGSLQGNSLDSQLIHSLRERDSELFMDKAERICKEDNYEGKKEDAIRERCPLWMRQKVKDYGLSEELFFWYHIDTLNELLKIYGRIQEEQDEALCHVRKCVFTAILKDVCSQKGHFTYITDNCRPPLLIYCKVVPVYLAMLDRLSRSIDDFLKQFTVVNRNADLNDLISRSIIHCGDARKLNWLDEESVDFILTSPPYLCAQDYVKTMRLIYLFFPSNDFIQLPNQEIGARACRKRDGQKIVKNFYDDMGLFFKEATRVLKRDKFFCLIFGQGKAKAIEGYDTVSDLCTMVLHDFHFRKIFETSRNISYKWNRLGGVNKEKIIIFQKKY